MNAYYCQITNNTKRGVSKMNGLSKLDISVLYVEDEDQIRSELSEFLAIKISRVTVASNGMEGLQKFKDCSPDLVITDIRMPVMNGLEMSRQIKEINREIPIIITSAYNDSEYLFESIDIGVSQYILKPIKIDQLLSAILKCNESYILTHKLDQARSLLADYKRALDYSSIVLKLDKRGIISYINDEAARVSGYIKSELIGQPFSILDDRENALDETGFMDMFKQDSIWKGVIRQKSRDGGHFFVNTTVVPIMDEESHVLQYIMIGNEVTELINKEKQLLDQLLIDNMTGLPNRRSMLSDIEKLHNPSLILVNIDSFQEMNDFYGNDVGDWILLEMSNRLRSLTVSQNYMLYKLPADEFAVLIENMPDLAGVEREASHYREGLTDLPFVYQENEIYISVTLGIAHIRADGDDEPALARKRNLPLFADMALKKAKQNRKHYVIYDESLEISKEYASNIHWTKKLKDAIHTEHIVPYFQPIVNNATRKIEKYECLARLIDNEGKVIAPFFFMNISKKTRLYHHITKMVLKRSIDAFRYHDYEFSINLSVDDILSADTNIFIKEMLIQHPEISKRLVFEILESEGIENYEEVMEFIREVKSFGCKIAIDDFGTGYSNFDHIMRLQVDYIKIDASLTKNIVTEKNSRIVTKIIADFAKNLGIRTISEFVDSEEVYQIVKDLGVDFSQGYYFGKPEDVIAVRENP